MQTHQVSAGAGRIQAHFRAAARQQYDVKEVPPFTLFFHPSDPLPWLNYAIPDEPCGGDLSGPLSRLEAAFRARSRAPRFEYVEAFSPRLSASLRKAGYVDEARPFLMTLAPRNLRTPPAVNGLTLQTVAPGSPLGAAKRFLALQRRAFGLGDPAKVSKVDADWFLAALGDGRAFVARFSGQDVATGMFTHPLDGLSEIVGIATLEPFRRRGIGAAVTYAAATAAFACGASELVLAAADERAGRVYAGIGFRPAGSVAVLGFPAAP